MKHIVKVKVDTESPMGTICQIDHAKHIFFDPNDPVTAGEVIANDINTLLTALVCSIRKGGELGVLNKVTTMGKAIDYMKSQISFIDLDVDASTAPLDIVGGVRGMGKI